MFIVEVLRILTTVAGVIVVLMWLAGTLGLADFQLLFEVRP